MSRPEVFLSHASADKASVKAIALQLQERAIPVWLDEWNLVPGQPWVDAMGQALRECRGCVVFLGPGGAGPWHHEEARTALDLAARDRSYPLVPVLLPGAKPERLSQLPDFLRNRTWVDFAKGLDDAEALHRLVCGIQGKEPGRPGGAPYVPGGNPYRGLRVFDVDDAPLFFGRDLLIMELFAMLGREARFVSIVGPSGSGKSSLARAGLLACLRAGRIAGSQEWPQVIVRPGAFPLESLAFGIGSKLSRGVDPSALVRRFGAGEQALHREVGMALQDRPNHRAVLLVDQAEEAFTLADSTDRAAFLANLVYAATVRTGQTLLVLAFRADFYPRFAEHQQLAALVSEKQLLVSPMSEAQLREAIELPAQRRGRPLRPTLVDELLRDAGGQPGSLPLLEHALEQLWEKPERSLGIEEYRSIGGIAGALNSRAEAVFETLSPAQQVSCRRLFLRLVQHGEDVLDTRRRIRADELPADQREVSHAFAAEGFHLLTWSRENGREVLEVAHEELFRRWNRLEQWVRKDRLGQRIHRRLVAATAEWGTRPEDNREEFLYRGLALTEVEEWLASLPDAERANLLNHDEATFVKQSRAATDRARLEQERRTRDTEQLAEMNRALQAAHAAALSRELAAVAMGDPNRDPQLSLALLKEAHRRAPVDEVFPVLAKWSAALGRAELRGHSAPVTSAAFSPDGSCIVTASNDNTVRLWGASSRDLLAILSGHSGPVRSVAFDPEGSRLLTASDDKTARLWDTAGKPLVILGGHTGPVLNAMFSPDGAYILTASDYAAQLWGTSSGKSLATFSGHSSPLTCAVFSPDGSCIFTASLYTARLWDASTHQPLATLALQQSHPVYSAAFSPDGTRILTVSNYTVRLWNVSQGNPLITFSGHSAPINHAAFNVDGSRVVTSGDDNTARLWDSSTGRALATLSGHSQPVRSATFSPDGARIVTASDDNTARLWDVWSGRSLAVLSGHSRKVRSAVFSPANSSIVTTSDDKTARLWDASSSKHLAVLTGHSQPLYCAAFSPDGACVVTASADHTARLWNAYSGKHLTILSGHAGPVHCAAFSPDGSRIVTTSDDNTARLWDSSSGKHLATLSGHSGSLYSAAFSPDGSRIVTASDDNTARLWDASSSELLATFSGHDDWLLRAAFSPDGSRIVTASYDKTARLWSISSGTNRTLAGHSGPVRSAIFSPDGSRVLTAGDDHTARLWDASSGEHLATLSGHSRKVYSAAFSPDGSRIITASDDSTAQLWDASSGKPLASLSDHSGPVYSAAFSPDGCRIVTAGFDNIALVWQDLLWAPTSRRLELLGTGRDLTSDERRTYLHEVQISVKETMSSREPLQSG